MPFAILLVLVFIGFGINYEKGHNTNEYGTHDIVKSYDPSINGFQSTLYNDPNPFPEKLNRIATYSNQNGDPLSFSYQDTKGHFELVETTLGRTCRAINILAHQFNCANPDDPTLTWAFLLTLPNGNIGTLNDVYSGSMTTTFSCSARTDGSYGRGLIAAAIPQQYVQNKGYNYDLSGVVPVAGRNDPCGYIELLSN